MLPRNLIQLPSKKTVGAGSPTWYVGGADGKTEVVYAGSTSNPSYNVFGANGLIGQVKRTGAALNRIYHLKDHLGSVRVTVRGDSTVLADDFSGTLSQWTTVLGSGFTIVGGELSNSSANDNVAVNASSTLFADGIVGADVTNLTGYAADANIVFRYQNPSNYYMVQAFNYQVMAFKKKNGQYNNVCNYTGSTAFLGGPYKLQATVTGHNIKVYWKGVQVLDYTDTDNDGTAWLSGKVGVRQCYSRTIHWDNFYAITTCPAQVVAFDDYYPFGQYMDTRSYNAGFSDARYKYTEKERDGETGYDYFGARYYDARVGRWMSVDPLAVKYPEWEPYTYCFDKPSGNRDLDGRGYGLMPL
jgi:RHS repeat-associated protein